VRFFVIFAFFAVDFHRLCKSKAGTRGSDSGLAAKFK